MLNTTVLHIANRRTLNYFYGYCFFWKSLIFGFKLLQVDSILIRSGLILYVAPFEVFNLAKNCISSRKVLNFMLKSDQCTKESGHLSWIMSKVGIILYMIIVNIFLKLRIKNSMNYFGCPLNGSFKLRAGVSYWQSKHRKISGSM